MSVRYRLKRRVAAQRWAQPLLRLRRRWLRGRTTKAGAPRPATPITQQTPGPDRARTNPAKTAATVQGPLSPYESLAPRRKSLCVVVIAHSSLHAELTRWLDQFPTDHRFVLSTDVIAAGDAPAATVACTPTCAEMSAAMLRFGRVDVLVNLLPTQLLPSDAPTHRDIWWELYFNVWSGGLYVLPRPTASGPELANALDDWQSAITAPADAPKPSRRDAELIVSTAATVMTRDLLIMRKRVTHYVKLRDAEANELLPLLEPGIRLDELAHEPAGELLSRARVTSHESAVEIRNLGGRFSYPELHLRHYHGKIAFSGRTLMFGQRSVLPDSFRHHLRHSLWREGIINATPRYARIGAAQKPKTTLTGDYYQLDSTFPGHFGHLTTEVTSRLWGWDRAKEQIPDLKVLLRTDPEQEEPVLERRFFEAYGVAAEDIVWTDEPVYVESLVCATPMWHNLRPFYVHPGILAVWDRLGGQLIDPAAPTYERIFVSRHDQPGRRICHNRDDVERLFAARGFEVIYPEDLDLGTQAGVFANAKVIAGFGGSAMFNLMFAKRVETTILLSQEAYIARNEHLFTSLIGGDVHYFWSTPDIPQPPGAFTMDAFLSDWTFDFDRNGVQLETLIDSL